MTAYDLSDLISARPGFGLVKSHLENMRVKSSFFSSVSLLSASAAAYANFATLNITGLVPTDLVVVFGRASLSSGTAVRTLRSRMQLNSSNGQDQYYYCATANTSGNEHSAEYFRFGSGYTGTIAADLEWRYSGSSTTHYCDQHSIVAFVFKSAA